MNSPNSLHSERSIKRQPNYPLNTKTMKTAQCQLILDRAMTSMPGYEDIVRRQLIEYMTALIDKSGCIDLSTEAADYGRTKYKAKVHLISPTQRGVLMSTAILMSLSEDPVIITYANILKNILAEDQ